MTAVVLVQEIVDRHSGFCVCCFLEEIIPFFRFVLVEVEMALLCELRLLESFSCFG